MPQIINATQARTNFADILNRVLYRGEEFLVKKQGKPAVLITRPRQNKFKRTPKKKISGIEFLLGLTKYNLKNAPKDFAKNHDKYIWE